MFAQSLGFAVRYDNFGNVDDNEEEAERASINVKFQTIIMATRQTWTPRNIIFLDRKVN